MVHVSTAVGELFVEDHGSGPALLCWPSLFCDARTLAPVIDAFSRDHRVIVVEGPGHGRSGTRGRRFSLEDCADAAARVLDRAGVERASWIGAAWGGHVGLVMALRHPERLERLVVMNAPVEEWSSRRRALFWLSYLLLRTPLRAMIAKTIASKQIAKSVHEAHPERAQAIVDCIVSSPRSDFLLAVRSAMLDRPTLLPLLPKIRVPTLFLTGAEDELYPVPIARRHAESIPTARFCVVEATAHASLWEAPERVLPLLSAFLTGPEARDGALESTAVDDVVW